MTMCLQSAREEILRSRPPWRSLRCP
jgi:hypothetical protein